MSDERNETQQPQGPEAAQAAVEDAPALQVEAAAAEEAAVDRPASVEVPAAPAPPQAPFPYGEPSVGGAAAGPAVPPPVAPAGAYAAYQSVAPQPACAPVGASSPVSGKVVGALVCGILSILTCETVLLGVALGSTAIVLAASAAKEGLADGKAVAGRICGIIGLVLSTLTLLMYLALAAVGIAWFDRWAVYYGADEWHEAVQEILDGELDVDYHDGHAYVHIGKDSVGVRAR